MSFPLLFTLVSLLTPTPFAFAQDDSLQWLEEVDSARSLEWVNQHNSATSARLQSRAIYPSLEKEMKEVVTSNARLPSIGLNNGLVYNFWQNSSHPRGLWRRISFQDYKNGADSWELLLDLDKLDRDEGKDWVWKSVDCLQPAMARCLISLSPGGGDAVEVREFDLSKKAFVEGGFLLPVAKSDFSWIDEDTIDVATDFGPGSMSKSGYPLIVKRWKRGTPLSEAVELFHGEPEDMTVSTSVIFQPGWKPVFRTRYLSFFESELSLVSEDGKKLTRVPMPTDADFNAVIGSKAFFTLHSELKTKTRTFPTGALVAFPLLQIGEGEAALERLEVVFAPSEKRFLSAVFRSGNSLLLNVLDNVRGKVLRADRLGSGWRLTDIAMGANGMAEVTKGDAYSTHFLASYMDFVTPTTQFLGNSATATVEPLRASPAFFDSKGLLTEQFEATSKDGTKIPFFVTHRRDLKLDGSNPTLLYAYGGFNVSMTPWYSGTMGKAWLEKGGVHVVANIRGGGEFGPAWHEAARKEKHQNAFDDFIAVAERLIEMKITSPIHLGIEGGSNGGLLMGAVTTQRPDLFNAVLCEVPLLDMMRYHLLLAGASWIDEYGNPEIPAERDYILKYSPYQNVKAGMKYPEVYFTTSTRDDRVHPGHARKMAALMESLGYSVYYFENTEGGHGGSATPEQKARLLAMQYSYLWSKLSPADR